MAIGTTIDKGGTTFCISADEKILNAWKKFQDVTVQQRTEQSKEWQWLYTRMPWVKLTSLSALYNSSLYVAPDYSQTEAFRKAANEQGSNFVAATFKNAADIKKTEADQKSESSTWDEAPRKVWTLTGIQANSDGKPRSNFENIYSNNHRPAPGVLSVKVEYKGGFGSTREATVNFKAWDDNQLKSLEVFFMAIGSGARIEWGWSQTPEGRSVAPITEGGTPLDIEMQEKIRENKKKFDGCYDGMQGIISNFNWSKQQDGSYDCEMKIISPGDCFINMPIHTQHKMIKVSEKVKTKDNIFLVTDDILGPWQIAYEKLTSGPGQGLLADAITFDNKIWKTASEVFKNKKDNSYYLDGLPTRILGLSTSARVIKEREWEDRGWMTGLAEKITGRPVPYVTLEYILSIIINRNIALYKTTGEIYAGIECFPNKPITVSYPKNILSVDPEICIIPDKDMLKIAQTIYSDGFLVFNNKLFPQNALNVLDKQFLYSGNVCDLKFLLVNMYFLRDCMEGSNTIHEFLQALLSGISNAVCNKWNFSIDTTSELDETHGNLLRIVETGTLANTQPTTIPLHIFNGINGSAIRSYNMASDISSEMASLALYGTNRERTQNPSKSDNKYINKKELPGQPGISLGFTTLFGTRVRNLGIGANPLQLGVPDDQYNKDTDGEKATVTDVAQELKNIIKSFVDAYVKAYIDEFSQENSDNLRKAYEVFYNRFSTTQTNYVEGDNNRPMLPIKFSFVSDGFALFSPGYVVEPTFLPEHYQKHSMFQIISVNHSIGDGKWETEVQTVIRPIINPKNVTGTNTTNNEVATNETKEYTPQKRRAKLNGVVFEVENGKVDEADQNILRKVTGLPDYLYFERESATKLFSFNNAFKEKFGKNIPIGGAYRTFDTQISVYEDPKKIQSNGNHMGAVPGTSNHGWGLAFDLIMGKGYWITNSSHEAHKWLVDNGPKYNWVWPSWARPEGSKPESWHFEFIGPTSYIS